MTGASVSWSSSLDAVAIVSNSGLLTAVSNGNVTITATVGSASGTATVGVQQVPATITLSPGGTLVLARVGATASVTALVADAGGTEVTDPAVTWSSDDESVATVVAGLVTAIASGSATITVETGALQGQFTVTVRDARYPRFTFASVVRGVVGSPFGQNISVGDSITGTVTYDVQVPGVSAGATGTWYDMMIVAGITVVVGGRVYSSNTYSIIVSDNVDMGAQGFWDGYNISSVFGGDLFEDGSPIVGTIGVASWDVTGLLLSSESLLDFDPTSFPNQLQLLQDNSNFFQADVELVAVSQSP